MDVKLVPAPARHSNRQDGGLAAVPPQGGQRWRDLAVLSADFVFETDAAGAFSFVGPDRALGWASDEVIGQNACDFLAAGADAVLFNPFRVTEPVRRRRAWLHNATGRPSCLEFAVMPVRAADGAITGVRGLAQDVTDREAADAAVATALHRRELVDFILNRMRQEVLAPRMMEAALGALMQGMGGEGCAIIDMLGETARDAVTHHVGVGLDSFDDSTLSAIASLHGAAHRYDLPDGRPAIVAPSQTRFGEEASLIIWRAPGARGWDAEDVAVVASAANIVRVIIEQMNIQSEMARQARTDPLTGLMNRRAFFEEVDRRVGRLEREDLPGTLMYVDLDNFKTLNDLGGHDAGDEALRIVADLLRTTVRPTDLVSRLGGDEFAIWLDGADELAAAERADSMKHALPGALAHLAIASRPGVTASIGIATRWPGSTEDIDGVMMRADRAMYEVKRAGRNNWRVSRPE
ncbi:MAG: sensor domain-containing diguanylate cyclase [Acidisphaera sp.]|nr:sensor domain-containing diguanylate cyclase [Acidisphaera sp.]MBV9814063.1 sensor domain-containing diguanylate cyclase [Acetobacteraceae bacterium]